MSWPTTRLADHCEVITKGTTPTTLGHEFTESGVPFLRVQNIGGGSVTLDQDTLFIDESTHRILERSQIRPGDVLVSIAGTIGRAGVVPEEAPPLNCNQAVAIVRPKKDVHRPFLRYWLESYGAQAQMRGATVTGTIANLSLTQLGNLKLPLPPESEQRRIAEILDKADALRAKRRAALAQLDTLTQSIFLDSFVKNGHFATQRLDSVCELITDGTHYTPTYSDTGVVFLSSRNVTSGYIDWDDVKHIPESLHLELHRRVAPTLNDILLAKNGTTGVAAIVDRNVTFDIYVSLALLRASECVLPIYLREAINSPACTRQFSASLKGIGVPNLHLKEIRQTRIPVPPIELQRRFTLVVEATELERKAHRASLAGLDSLFASLQHRAFRGEL